MAKGWRVTDTYIRCVCDSTTMGNDRVNVFKYHPVIGSGYIELNGNEEWGDYVIPIEYDRFKTKVELLRDLGCSVMFIAQKLDTTEDEVRKIVGKDYVHKNYSEMRSEDFMLLNENGRLRDEISELKRQNEILQAKLNAVSGVNDCCDEECKKLTEENASLKIALESVKADNLLFEHRGKELTEENANLTKQLSDLQDAYHRLYGSRDDHVKHIEALEFRVKELSEENEGMRTTIGQLSEAKNAWAEEAHRYKEELATANAKHADTMRSKNGLEYETYKWRAEARDYKNMYLNSKGSYTELSKKYTNLMVEVERLRTHNRTLTDLITDLEQLRMQRNMAIRLLFCTHDYDEIANALHIPESVVRVIIAEVIK